MSPRGARWSLRQRLLAAAVLAGTAFAVTFGLVATWRLDQIENNAVRSALQARMDLAKDRLTPEGTIPQSGPVAARISLAQVVGPDGRIRSATPALAGLAPLIPLDQALASGSAGARASLALEHPDIDLAVLAVPVNLSGTAAGQKATGELVVALDTEAFRSTRQHLTTLLAAGLTAAVAVLALTTWLLAGRALRSVTRLTEEAEVVSLSDIGRGLPVPTADADLARLVAALNRMLDRLHAGHRRDLAFAADASHRLRTPLATLRAEAELALAVGDPAQMRTALSQIVADADHLARILDRMLAADSRTGREPPEQLIGLIPRLAQRWRRQAQAAGLQLNVWTAAGPDGAAAVSGRELAAIIDPLVENAMQHTPAGGSVEVRVTASAAEICAQVANTGSGVAPELRDRLFEPWVSSRSASSAGGLGLWLARETARAIGGEVWLTDPADGHTVFSVRLPAALSGARRET